MTFALSLEINCPLHLSAPLIMPEYFKATCSVQHLQADIANQNTYLV